MEYDKLKMLANLLDELTNQISTGDPIISCIEKIRKNLDATMYEILINQN